MNWFRFWLGNNLNASWSTDDALASRVRYKIFKHFLFSCQWQWLVWSDVEAFCFGGPQLSKYRWNEDCRSVAIKHTRKRGSEARSTLQTSFQIKKRKKKYGIFVFVARMNLPRIFGIGRGMPPQVNFYSYNKLRKGI